MNPDLDALATRLYVTVDDLLINHPEWAPERPAVGIAPQLTEAELITLAVIQALLGFTSEARFIRHAHTHLRSLFPYLPQRPAYNKRLRHAAATMQHVIGALARDCPSWHDDLWLVDSTPVECGRSRETVKHSDMTGLASYGYCASHSRWFWGLRLHLIATPSGLPVAYALTSATTDERDTALAMIELDTALCERPGQILMASCDAVNRAADRHTAPHSGFRNDRPCRRPCGPQGNQRIC
jgi:Transposase DDE domain